MSMTVVTEMVRASLRPFAERAARVGELSKADADELLETCEDLMAFLDRLQVRFDAMLHRGSEARRFAAALRQQLDVLDDSAKALRDLRTKAVAAGAELRLMAELDAAEEKVRQMRTAPAKLLTMIENLPPLDLSKIPPEVFNTAGKTYISHEEMMARLRRPRGE